MGADKTGVIIVAAGSGSRMGGPTPKQFLMLAGKPVLVHTVERFLRALPDAGIVVAIGAEHTRVWSELAQTYGLEGRCRTCAGGPSRFHSVQNALEALGQCDTVLIHDGVRPLVGRELILRMADAAGEYGAAIPVLRPVDSFRITEGDGLSSPFERDRLRAVQTPQAFRGEVIRKAYAMEFDPSFTDDATVAESAGFRIELVEGQRSNMKITTPEDMEIASLLMEAGY